MECPVGSVIRRVMVKNPWLPRYAIGSILLPTNLMEVPCPNKGHYLPAQNGHVYRPKRDSVPQYVVVKAVFLLKVAEVSLPLYQYKEHHQQQANILATDK